MNILSTQCTCLTPCLTPPPVLRRQFVDAPDDYDTTYLKMSRRGARVLALGRRDLGRLSHQQVKELTRQGIEAELEFVGFVIISCPLKADSRAVIREILASSHQVRCCRSRSG